MARAKIEPSVRVNAEFEVEWPGASALATECILNLTFLVGQLEAFGQSLVREYGVSSLSAFNVLTILHGAGEALPPSLIAERMVVTRGTITAILDSLERHGLVHRRPHVRDGRMRLVAPTAQGLACVDLLRPRLHESERLWVSCLTTSQQETLLGLVARLQANAIHPGAELHG